MDEKDVNWKKSFLTDRKAIEALFAPNMCSEKEESNYEEQIINGKRYGVHKYATEFDVQNNPNFPTKLNSFSIIKTKVEQIGNKHHVKVEKLTLIDSKDDQEKIIPLLSDIATSGIKCKSSDIHLIDSISQEVFTLDDEMNEAIHSIEESGEDSE